MPERQLEDGAWIHPSRLPLGNGWDGRCFAPGYEGIQPSREQLHEFCNLGYAFRCPRLPKQRACDAVRFAVSRECGAQLFLGFVCETAHLPADHGILEYDLTRRRWLRPHPDPRIQQMAECYLQQYLDRTMRSATLAFTSSTNP
jgi:hypothetical protein